MCQLSRSPLLITVMVIKTVSTTVAEKTTDTYCEICTVHRGYRAALLNLSPTTAAATQCIGGWQYQTPDDKQWSHHITINQWDIHRVRKKRSHGISRHNFAKFRPHSHWYECRLQVTRTSETRTSGAFTVTRTSTNTCKSVAIKNLVKLWNILNFLQKIYSNIAGNVVR